MLNESVCAHCFEKFAENSIKTDVNENLVQNLKFDDFLFRKYGDFGIVPEYPRSLCEECVKYLRTSYEIEEKRNRGHNSLNFHYDRIKKILSKTKSVSLSNLDFATFPFDEEDDLKKNSDSEIFDGECFNDKVVKTRDAIVSKISESSSDNSPTNSPIKQETPESTNSATERLRKFIKQVNSDDEEYYVYVYV